MISFLQKHTRVPPQLFQFALPSPHKYRIEPCYTNGNHFDQVIPLRQLFELPSNPSYENYIKDLPTLKENIIELCILSMVGSIFAWNKRININKKINIFLTSHELNWFFAARGMAVHCTHTMRSESVRNGCNMKRDLYDFVTHNLWLCGDTRLTIISNYSQVRSFCCILQDS